MLTAIAQGATRLLRYIRYRDASCGCPCHPTDCIFEDASVLLLQLEGGGLVRCVCREAPDKPESYELCKPLESVNPLSLLLILNEGICPVPPDVDEQRVYGRYGAIISHMGMANQMVRSIFGEIHLTELCLWFNFQRSSTMNRVLLLLLYVFLLSAPTLGQRGGACPARRCDSLHTFRFVQGRDVLCADYRGDDHELKRLFAVVTAFRSSITDGEMRIYVDGYCTSGSSVCDSLRLGYVRNSCVKSKLITHRGMKEAWSVAHNHAVPCPDEERDAVVVCLHELLTADTLSPSRYAGYASRYPLLLARAPSLPKDGTCPVPALHEQSYPLVAEHIYPARVGSSRAIFSLKISLSDWAGLTPEDRLAAFRPNLAAELCFARRWSVMASAAYSGWKGGKKHRFWGVSGVSLEPHLWLREDGRYHRFYLGVYGQLGDFDYQPSPSGSAGVTDASRTGYYWHTGLSFGVYLPLSRHQGIEAGVRGGCRSASAKACDNEPPHAYYHHDASSVR